MFRCEYSGERSKPAKWAWRKASDLLEANSIQGMVYERISSAEKPVKIVIESESFEHINHFIRERNWKPVNCTSRSSGSRIVKELTIRAKYFDEVRKKFELT